MHEGLNNGMMASKPGLALWLDVVDVLKERAEWADVFSAAEVCTDWSNACSLCRGCAKQASSLLCPVGFQSSRQPWTVSRAQLAFRLHML